MSQPQSVDEFKQRIDQFLEPIIEAKATLDSHDHIVAGLTEDRDAAAYRLQYQISTVVHEKVFTKEFLESKGYKQAVGRKAVKVDVEPADVPFESLGEYINTTFSLLENHKRALDNAVHDMEEEQAERDVHYRGYADAVYAALDSKLLSRAQLSAFGFPVPPKSATSPAQPEAEAHEDEQQGGVTQEAQQPGEDHQDHAEQ